MYNISVAGTHNYLVGQDGLVVHNTCGNLDDLANRFINNFSKAIKKNEINTWWATGYPKFFKRGTFFEKLMARSPKYTGWTLTPHTWPVIDFQKRIGNTIKVISMKTTITSNVNDWMSTNSNHLIKLNNLQIATAQNGGGLPEIRALHIFVKDSELSNFSNWASVIKSKYPNIKEVVLNSIEKEFNL